MNDPTVICAWCGKTIKAGSDVVSHGMRDDCLHGKTQPAEDEGDGA